MHPRPHLVVAFAAAVFASCSAFASDSNILVIKGKVIDDDGRPADNAQVRVKTLDRKAPDKIVHTDSRGQYMVVGLVLGNYTVTAYDFFGSARSRAWIKTNRKGWASVNFDFKLDSMVGDRETTMKGQVHVISGHAFGSPR
jgi:hypothetical protein